MLCGGHSRMHESVGRETAVLHLDSLVWEMPEGAMQTRSLLGHSTSVVGRNKLLLFGGSHGEEASAVVQQLATDSMKWSSVSTSSASAPQPRLCHAAASLSDKVGRGQHSGTGHQHDDATRLGQMLARCYTACKSGAGSGSSCLVPELMLQDHMHGVRAAATCCAGCCPAQC